MEKEKRKVTDIANLYYTKALRIINGRCITIVMIIQRKTV